MHNDSAVEVQSLLEQSGNFNVTVSSQNLLFSGEPVVAQVHATCPGELSVESAPERAVVKIDSLGPSLAIIELHELPVGYIDGHDILLKWKTEEGAEFRVVAQVIDVRQ